MGLEWDIKNEHVGFGWKPFRGLGSKVVGSVIFWVVEWDICEGLKGFHHCWSCCYWWCFLGGWWRSSWDWVIWWCMNCGVKRQMKLEWHWKRQNSSLLNTYSMVRDFTSWGIELIGTQLTTCHCHKHLPPFSFMDSRLRLWNIRSSKTNHFDKFCYVPGI